MIEYLDKKLATNGLAQHAMEMKDPHTLFIQACCACVGIREKTGRNDGPMVELLQKTIGGAENESWCMSFIQTCLAYAEHKTSMNSRIYPSEHCLTVWTKSGPCQRAYPSPGDIVVWRHGNTSNGHTGCVIDFVGEHIFKAVEGNTNAGSGEPGGPVEREGGGVYYTARVLEGNGDMKVLGFLKPF